MLKNPLMEELRAQITPEAKAMMDESFALADRIHFLLQKHHMTQRQLAEKLGKRESEVSKWLSGGHNFTTSTLTKISLAIGERIYYVPGEQEEYFSVSQTVDVNSLKSYISRVLHVHTVCKDEPYQSFASSEISNLEVCASGIISKAKVTSDAAQVFTVVHLKPEAFKKIEQATVS